MATPIYDEDGNIIDYTDDTATDDGNDTVSGGSGDSFDWEQFYTDYGDVSGGYDPATSPTEKEVQDAIDTGKSDNPFLKKVFDSLGTAGSNFIKKYLYDSDTGKVNLAGMGALATGLYSIFGSGSQIEKGGYNKPIPQLTATRAQVPYAADPNRRPGEAGRQYFTDTQYTAPADAAAAQTAATTQAQGIAAAYKPQASQVNPYEGRFKAQWNPPPPAATTATTAPASGVAQLMPVPKAESLKLAQGGIADMAKGRYLAGATDGMADKIPTSIDGKDPAALSHGEFVIPADVVSHLGNGNSEAGAQKLYDMMERVRKARTGNPNQGKRINPDKFMPGGLAYAAGGEVKKFTDGGNVSVSSSLSPWAGPYVSNLLGRAEALGNAPYQAYQGPLTAGPSDLQQQAFAGIGSLAQAGYTPQTYTGGTFGAEQAQQYMNPYIQAALDPQLAEMRRQSDISRVADAGRLTQAGAFGGSRQAIMESEGRRNLLDKQTQAIGTGYQTAYDKAMQQYNADQERRLGAEKASEASRQYSADYGLRSLGEMARLGGIQRDITAEGIAADKAEFEKQRDYPAAMIKFQRDLITGLPIETRDTSATTDAIGKISGQISDLVSLYKTLAALGQG